MKKTKGTNCLDLGERELSSDMLPTALSAQNKALGIQNTIAYKENSTETEGKVQSRMKSKTEWITNVVSKCQ